MAIIRFTERPGFRNPWTEFERIRQGLDQFSRNFMDRDVQQAGANVFPPLNVYEDKDTIIVKAELPGVNAEDLSVSLEGETLTIQGSRNPIDNGNLAYHRREIERGSFSRAVSVPAKVDPDSIAAKLRNGILTVTMQKAAEVKPRQVTVTTEE